jgi:hypothetical protein
MKNFIQKLRAGFISIGILAFIIIFGCNQMMILSGSNQNRQRAMIKAFTPPEDETIATNYIALLRQNRFEPIEKDIDPSLKDALTREMLAKMAKIIPTEDPVSVKVVGADQVRNADLYRINLSFEYQFPSKWILINVATQKKAGILPSSGLKLNHSRTLWKISVNSHWRGRNPFYSMRPWHSLS